MTSRAIRVLVLAAPIAIAPAATAAVTLQRLAITRIADATVVTFEADAALPAPAIGVLDAPPRVFLDFPDLSWIVPDTIAPDDPLVSRIRIARNTLQPPVTRVVLDLRLAATYRLLRGGDEPLRMAIVIIPRSPWAAADQPASIPVSTGLPLALWSRPGVPIAPPPRSTAGIPSSPPAAARPAPAPFPRPAPRPAPPALPPRDVQRYLAQAGPVLDRLAALRPLLWAIDIGAQDVNVAHLAAAEKDLQDAQRALASVKTPESLRPTHDLLSRACGLALLAVRIRRGPAADDAAAANAASAAAGAVLLLDRVREQLPRKDTEQHGRIRPAS